MAINIPALLDKAIFVHSLSSDYKLALVMGISQSSLISYRHGKTLPDARIISKLCDLTGDDPALIAAEIEEMRINGRSLPDSPGRARIAACRCARGRF